MKEVKGMYTSSNQNRRRFLKKALYATPTLAVLGTLAKPTQLLADSGIVGPPGGRGLNSTSTSTSGTGLAGKSLGS